MIIRPVWVYGCDTHLDKFKSNCLNKEKIPVFNESYFFSVIHAEDLAEVYVAVIERRGKGDVNVAEN